MHLLQTRAKGGKERNILMAYISLPNTNLPGISGLFAYRTDTAVVLREFAELLLRSESTLSNAERELIAASVSHWNDCHFCRSSHGAAAAAHLQCDLSLLGDIQKGLTETPVSGKLRALLALAHKVQQSGKSVEERDIENAKTHGASEREIHDTVLIAAAFCMFNRYVDGLGTWAPAEAEAYSQMGMRLAQQGYIPKPNVDSKG